MPNSLELTPEQISAYRRNAQRRREQERPEIERRRERAWESARRAARVLKKQFGVTRIVVFGSLARDTGFTRWSDVDIAAWGIAMEDTFRAIGVIMDLETEVPVNLVDVNTASPSLLETIEREGIAL
jgi:predicted nucleotidyltransferase